MSVKFFVGNLPYSMNEQELQTAFSEGGRTIQSVRIVLDRDTQRPRGFAFVEVPDEEAEAFKQEWNQKPLAGRPVHVERAQERSGGSRAPAPRGTGFQPRERNFSRPPGPGHSQGYRNAGYQNSYLPPQDDKRGDRSGKKKSNRTEKNYFSEKRASSKKEVRERGKWHWSREKDE